MSFKYKQISIIMERFNVMKLFNKGLFLGLVLLSSVSVFASENAPEDAPTPVLGKKAKAIVVDGAYYVKEHALDNIASHPKISLVAAIALPLVVNYIQSLEKMSDFSPRGLWTFITTALQPSKFTAEHKLCAAVVYTAAVAELFFIGKAGLDWYRTPATQK